MKFKKKSLYFRTLLSKHVWVSVLFRFSKNPWPLKQIVIAYSDIQNLKENMNKKLFTIKVTTLRTYPRGDRNLCQKDFFVVEIHEIGNLTYVVAFWSEEFLPCLSFCNMKTANDHVPFRNSIGICIVRYFLDIAYQEDRKTNCEGSQIF